MFAQKRKRKTKFEDFIGYISNPTEETTNLSICISFVNIFINSCDDAETRYNIYNELIAQGLVAKFSVQQLRKFLNFQEMKSKGIAEDVLQQIEIFENGLTDDHEEHMSTKKRNSRGYSKDSLRELHKEIASNSIRRGHSFSGSPMKDFKDNFLSSSPSKNGTSSPRRDSNAGLRARIFLWLEGQPLATVVIPFEPNTLVKEVKAKMAEKFPGTYSLR